MSEQGQGQGIFGTLYEGSSALGTFKADIGMIIGLILGALMIVFGLYYILFGTDDQYLRAQGVVMQAQCNPSTTYDSKGNPQSSYKCNITVGYKINGQTYSKQIYIDGSTTYVKDQPITLSVNKTNYQDVSVAGIAQSTMGSMSFVCALVIVGICYLNYYLTHHYKIWAATQGASTVIDVFR